jgi:hypothetical protein
MRVLISAVQRWLMSLDLDKVDMVSESQLSVGQGLRVDETKEIELWCSC